MNIRNISINMCDGEEVGGDLISLKKAINRHELTDGDAQRLQYVYRMMQQIKSAWEDQVREEREQPAEVESKDTYVLDKLGKLHTLQKTLMCHKLSGTDRNVIRDIQKMIRERGQA